MPLPNMLSTDCTKTIYYLRCALFQIDAIQNLTEGIDTKIFHIEGNKHSCSLPIISFTRI